MRYSFLSLKFQGKHSAHPVNGEASREYTAVPTKCRFRFMGNMAVY